MEQVYSHLTEGLGKRPLARFFKLLSPDKRDVVHIYLYAIFNGLIALSLPLGIQAILNMISAGQLSTSWGILVGLVLLGLAVSGAITIMQMILTEVLQQRIFARAAFEFAYRIPRLTLSGLQKHFPPELVNRFFDTLTVQKGLSKILLDFTAAVLQIIFGLLLLCFYHPVFVAFSIVLVGILVAIIRFTGPIGLSTSLRESKHKYEVAHWLEELARNLEAFKLAGRTQLPLEKTDGHVSKYLGARKKHFRVLVLKYIIIVGFKVAVVASLLILGSMLVVDNQLNLGQFVAAEIVIILLLGSSEKVILSMETIYDILTALEKIGYVTDLPLEKGKGYKPSETATASGIGVKIKGLDFVYPGTKKSVISDLNLNIQPGEKVCIKGVAGSGKTTFLKLLAGLYPEFEGSITMGGLPIRNFCPEDLRLAVGTVFAETSLFDGTLMENITLGRKDLNLADVMGAASLTTLSTFVEKLPEGYQTRIEPEGRKLSQIMIRKILMTRALVNRPKLLLISDLPDDLETKEQERLAKVLTDKNAGWTLIVVSKNPIYMEKCDQVVEFAALQTD